jgi:YfiH family protein
MNGVEVDRLMRPDGTLHIDALEPFSGLVAFFATIRSLMNDEALRLFYEKPESQIVDGRINEGYIKALCGAFSLPYKVLETGAQVHGTYIASAVNTVRKHNAETDGLIVSKPGGCAAVFTADCQALILWEPIRRVAAVVHAGWRGAIAGIAGLAAAKVAEINECRPSEIYAFLGPAISAANFEVGPDISDAAAAVFPNYGVITAKGDKTFFSINESNRINLLRAGVEDYNIYFIKACTYRDNELFYSYRREGKDAGRMMAAVYIP